MDKIDKDQSIKICKNALCKWGHAMQKIVAIEECSELIEALENSLVTGFHNVEEETADVEIMCLQLRLMYGSLQVDEERAAIANRLIDNLESTAIIACSDLIKSISKEIRSKHSRIHERIAWMEIVCDNLRLTFNNDQVEQFKKSKLIRLRGAICNG